MKEIIWSLVPSEEGCGNVLRVVSGAAISVVGCDIGNEFFWLMSGAPLTWKMSEYVLSWSPLWSLIFL